MYVTYKKPKKSMPYGEIYEALLLQQDITPLIDTFQEYNTIILDANENFDLYERYQLDKMVDRLKRLAYNCSLVNDLSYHTFQIPKASGGFREISAPNDELKTMQNKIKIAFERNLFLLPSNNAHGFTYNRNTKTALEQHKNNNSKWFLKMDIKDFFPSWNKELILKQLQGIFPFTYLLQNQEAEEAINQILDICLLDNKLPQGSPVSPLLTNILMIPFDYEIQNSLPKDYIYTRYADDILISSMYNFNWQNIQSMVECIVSPLLVKRSKTRYSSSNGRNWNLGLMLNKDNSITIGWRQKKLLKATLTHYALTDSPNINKHQLLGLISYYHMIEPKYIDYLLDKYSNKFNKDFRHLI